LLDALATGGRAADVAGLTRQVLRRAEIAGDVGAYLDVTGSPGLPTRDDWAAHSCTSIAGANGRLRVRADVWRPDWLPTPHLPDVAAAAGLPVAQRRADEAVPADPFFAEALGPGFTSYRGGGQRQAVRAATTLAPGATLLVNLPTGSGKTEVALAPALSTARSRGVSVLFVPTISLAQDMDRRVRAVLRATGRPDHSVVYTSQTGEDARARIREAVRTGTIPIVVTAPESGLRSLRPALRDAAAAGWLRYIAVDEAHLIRAWGIDFRPDLQGLAALRRELVDAAPDIASRCRTLLMSATFTPEDFTELARQYRAPGGIAVVTSNVLRSEPDYAFAQAPTEEERVRRVVDAVRHLPKPLFLYTSWIDDADEWVSRLRGAGLARVARVTGAVPGSERAGVLRGLRGDDAPTSIDVVVATSAFGLGISYDAVRTVVHACLPESVDRLYQEVGRAGRDGAASVALTVWTPEDRTKAAPLARPVVIGWAKAKNRWEAMRGTSSVDAVGRVRADLTAVPSHGSTPGDLNVSWNVATLALMVRAGFGSYVPADAADDDTAFTRRALVELDRGDLGRDDVWAGAWGPMAARVQHDAAARRRVVEQLMVPGTRVCDVLVDAFRIDAALDAGADLPSGAAEATPARVCGRCTGCDYAGFAGGAVPVARPVPEGVVDVRYRTVPTIFAPDRPTTVLAPAARGTAIVEEFVATLLRLGVRQFVVPEDCRELSALGDASRRYGPVIVADYDTDVPWLLPYVTTGVVTPLAADDVHDHWLIGRWQPGCAVLVAPTVASPLRGDRPIAELRPPGTMSFADLAGWVA
jgi:superfamily II DNA/RNA helicase